MDTEDGTESGKCDVIRNEILRDFLAVRGAEDRFQMEEMRAKTKGCT